jgi:hypothetical protein
VLFGFVGEGIEFGFAGGAGWKLSSLPGVFVCRDAAILRPRFAKLSVPTGSSMPDPTTLTLQTFPRCGGQNPSLTYGQF